MAISETAVKCSKHYMEKAKMPKVFTEEDTVNFGMYLGYKFALDMGELKERDLSKHDAVAYKELKPMKQYIDNTLFKETMNWGLMKVSEKEAKKAEEKRIKKAKKADKKAAKAAAESEPTILDTPPKGGYYIKKTSDIVGRMIDAVQDKMLDFSIWANEKLI